MTTIHQQERTISSSLDLSRLVLEHISPAIHNTHPPPFFRNMVDESTSPSSIQYPPSIMSTAAVYHAHHPSSIHESDHFGPGSMAHHDFYPSASVRIIIAPFHRRSPINSNCGVDPRCRRHRPEESNDLQSDRSFNTTSTSITRSINLTVTSVSLRPIHPLPLINH